ncbi:LLM class flavin-dependent oxidoreductase [Ktedonosporobacter rubrisoli]|uniref:LLM class flavin-dependent oxidoreductase n=1 Tax=Ktedonosporobacter rubrisoli TaxID=2509675 RepID=A0A4P6JZ25_KTERU|nr:LLM class flavin-dependent oxidoreductase [Ktedonosporobacter rubrisoli]QBD81118.1 LLM class flavin-dependent oxidoreductase [Ktedonosporobacter rubrisoli]
MTQVQFGFILPISNMGLSQQVFLSQVDAALEAVAGHFDAAWLPDHLQFGDNQLFEGWTMLTYLAALHPELRYGHLVLCQLFRNPALLAKMAATFQYLSQGRLIFGIGAGWAEEEARAYDLPFSSAGQRVSELEEQLQIITALWREARVSFEGKYHKVQQATCLPHPEPLPPVLIAGFRPRMLRLIARYADWWNTGIDSLEKVRTRIEMLDAACEELGRDPKTLRRTAMVRCLCAPTEQQAREGMAKAAGPFGPNIGGTPAQVAEQLQAFVELGFDYFMLVASDFPHELTTLNLLAHEVLPALNQGR